MTKFAPIWGRCILGLFCVISFGQKANAQAVFEGTAGLTVTVPSADLIADGSTLVTFTSNYQGNEPIQWGIISSNSRTASGQSTDRCTVIRAFDGSTSYSFVPPILESDEESIECLYSKEIPATGAVYMSLTFLAPPPSSNSSETAPAVVASFSNPINVDVATTGAVQLNGGGSLVDDGATETPIIDSTTGLLTNYAWTVSGHPNCPPVVNSRALNTSINNNATNHISEPISCQYQLEPTNTSSLLLQKKFGSVRLAIASPIVTGLLDAQQKLFDINWLGTSQSNKLPYEIAQASSNAVITINFSISVADFDLDGIENSSDNFPNNPCRPNLISDPNNSESSNNSVASTLCADVELSFSSVENSTNCNTGEFEWSYEVKNLGPSDSTNVIVNTAISHGNILSTNASCATGTDLLIGCNIGDLQVNANSSFYVCTSGF